MTTPIVFRVTDDGSLKPIPRFRKQFDQTFVCQDTVTMVEHEDRSMRSHDHQFAWVTEAWKNLPERLADLYPSPTHLRKRALIETGFYVQSQVEAGSHAAALRFATFMRADDEFCVAVVRDSIAIKRVAESQKRSAMGAKRFQESKTAILEWVSDLIGVTSDALQQEAA